MSLIDGTNLSVWRGGFFDRDNPDSVSLLFRLMWLADACANEGIYFSLNEAGRPYGVPNDRAIGRAGLSSIWTASGVSTVYYQKGREDLYYATGGAQGTPSAADPSVGPLASRHTRGTAADIDSNNYPRLYELAAAVGLKRTISSEPWHLDTVGDPVGVDFEPYSQRVYDVLNNAPTKTPEQLEEEYLMALTADLDNMKNALVDFIKRAGSRGATVVYWNRETQRTYSVSPRCIKHHANKSEYDIALREAGQDDAELSMAVTSEELRLVFYNNGLEEFVTADMARINKAPGGFLFVPGAVVPEQK